MKLDDYFKGWLVGDFSPSLIKTKEMEVGVKYYEQGTVEKAHFHKIATEYTIILSGTVNMLEKEYTKGDIVTIEPNVVNEFKSVTDSLLLVIKVPSSVEDKYEV